MKNIAIILFIVLSIKLSAQQSADTIISNNIKNLKLKVLYFHLTNRCNTCFSIEANVRKTISDNFSKELDAGLIDLYILNCELPENKELVKKYDAYGATLAFSAYINGVEQQPEDITGWAFQKAYNPDVFISELKLKIENHLK
ncbi:MAG: hypothetical protein KA792_02685 [Bacteroidales bacterium]|nr:hypothetical protein [Bacteroidales bacterium]